MAIGVDRWVAAQLQPETIRDEAPSKLGYWGLADIGYSATVGVGGSPTGWHGLRYQRAAY
jgi:hypothetical protein